MEDKKRESLVTINGEVMTTEERNRRMKLEYVNGGKSLKDIAIDYGLTYNTVRVMSCEQKWKEYKRQFEQKVSKEAEEQLLEVYVNTKVDVNLMYNNAWQTVMITAVRMLNTKEGLMGKDGQLSIYKLNALADVLSKAQAGQNLCTGFISKEAQIKLDMQREAMDLKNILAGLGDDEVIEDNFLQALNDAATKVFGDKHGNEKESKE
jgi:uncharacterized protein YjcR